MRKLLVLVALVLLAPVAPAAAQSPPGCTGNGLLLSASWTPGKGRAGLQSTLVVQVAQPNAAVCDVSGVTIRAQLPGPDGQPSGEDIVLPARSVYARGETHTMTVPWTVALNPGVTAAATRVTLTGTLQDGANSTVNLIKTITQTIAAPGMGLAAVADPASGTFPFDVTYRFTLTNTSAAPADPLQSVALAHPNCTPARVGGDTDMDGELDAGESWLYTCMYRFTFATVYDATTQAVAISASDGRRVDATPVTTRVTSTAGATLGRLTLTTVADPPSGVAPLTTAFTYTVRNEGTGPVKDILVQDAGCSPITTTGGSAPLEAGQARTYSCSRVFADAGVFTTGSIASGVDVSSGAGLSSAEVKTNVTATSPLAATPTPTAYATPDAGAGFGPTPTPTPTPIPTVRPRATISALSGSRKVSKRTRKVSIATVACPSGSRCTITAPRSVKLKLGRTTYTLPVSAAKTLAGGKRLTVTLTLPKTAYRRFKSATVSVKLRAQASGAATATRTVRARIVR